MHTPKAFSRGFVILVCLTFPLGYAGASEQSVNDDGNTHWVTIIAGGDAACWDGSPYSFYYRRADTERVVVWFQGGGGCSTRGNCDPDIDPTFAHSLDGREPWRNGRNGGIFDFENPKNPVKDHSFLVVPYCTGDNHLGANDNLYAAVEADQESLLVRHRGRQTACRHPKDRTQRR